MKKYEFYVYILECFDKKLYVGVTNDMDKRLSEHNNKMCEYTSKRLPVKVIYTGIFNDIRHAINFEKQIKGWSRKKKLALAAGDFDMLQVLSKRKAERDQLLDNL